MPKFYLTRNAGRPVVIDGKKFVFEAVDYFEPSHSWWGAFAAEAEEDVAALDKAVEQGLVSALSEEEYEQYQVKKKRAHVSTNIVALKNSHAPQSVANSGRPAEVVENPAPPKTADAIEEVLAPAPTKVPLPKSRSSRK